MADLRVSLWLLKMEGRRLDRVEFMVLVIVVAVVLLYALYRLPYLFLFGSSLFKSILRESGRRFLGRVWRGRKL